MAGRIVSISAASLITLGTGTVDQCVIKAGLNTPVRVKRMGINPVGTSNTDARIRWKLTQGITHTAEGTGMTVAQSGGISKGTGTLQTTANLLPTTVSGGSVVRTGALLPNGPYEIPLNIDLEAGEKLMLSTTVGTSQNAEIWFEIEE